MPGWIPSLAKGWAPARNEAAILQEVRIHKDDRRTPRRLSIDRPVLNVAQEVGYCPAGHQHQGKLNIARLTTTITQKVVHS